MHESSAEHNGFVIEFRTAGKQALDVHSFLSDRATNGSTIRQDIRDLLNETAAGIADLIEKERKRSLLADGWASSAWGNPSS